jgi:hypothetical protein
MGGPAMGGASQSEQQDLIDKARSSVQGTDAVMIDRTPNRVLCEATISISKGLPFKYRLTYSVSYTSNGGTFVEIYPDQARKVF